MGVPGVWTDVVYRGSLKNAHFFGESKKIYGSVHHRRTAEDQLANGRHGKVLHGRNLDSDTFDSFTALIMEAYIVGVVLRQKPTCVWDACFHTNTGNMGSCMTAFL